MGIRFNTEEERKSHPLAQLIKDEVWFDHAYFNSELDETSEFILSLDCNFFHEKECQLPPSFVYSIKHLYCVVKHSLDIELSRCMNLIKQMKLNIIQLAEVLIRTQRSEQLHDLVENLNDENTQKEIYRLAVRYDDLECVKQLEIKFLHNGGDKEYTETLLKSNDFDIYTGAIFGHSLSILKHFSSNFNFQNKPALQTKCLTLLKSSAEQGSTNCISALINLFLMNSFTPENEYYDAFTQAALNGHIKYLEIMLSVYKPSPNKLYEIYEKVIIENTNLSVLKFLDSIQTHNNLLFFNFSNSENLYTLALKYQRKEVFFHLLTQNIDAIYHFAVYERSQPFVIEYMQMILDTYLDSNEQEEEQKFNALIAILTCLQHSTISKFLPESKWQHLLVVEGMSACIHDEALRIGITPKPFTPKSSNERCDSKIEPIPTELTEEIKVVPTPQEQSISNVPEQPIALDTLLEKIASAYNAYEKHTRGIRFCIFHIHGEKGINRANKFKSTIDNNQTIKEQQEQVIAYLRDTQNGNTHPHSFRTMLLAKLLDKELSNESLRDVSANFLTYLEQYSACAPNDHAELQHSPS